VLLAGDARTAGQSQEKGSDPRDTPAWQHHREHEKTEGRAAGRGRRETFQGEKAASCTESLRGLVSQPQEPISTLNNQEGKGIYRWHQVNHGGVDIGRANEFVEN